MRARFVWSALAALGLVFAAAPARAADADPASWVPADAVLYLGVADVDQLVRDYQATAGYKLLDEMKSGGGPSVMGIATKALEKFRERLARMLEVPPGQLKSPFKGPAAFYAVVPDGKRLKDLEPGLVAGVGDAAMMKGYYETAVRKLKEMAGSYESVSAGENAIDVFTKKEGGDAPAAADDDEFSGDPLSMDEEELAAFLDKHLDKMFSPESMPPKLATCLTADRLIVAATPEQVKSVLRSESSGTLAESDEHRALVRTFDPLGGVRLMANLRRVFEITRNDPDTDDEDKKIMAALGVDAMQAVVGHLRLGAADFDQKMELQLLLRGDRAGIPKLISMENRDIAPPPSVSADTAIYASINLNPLEMLDEIERITRQIDPEQADEMRQGIESVPNPSGSGDPLNLRKELFENLRPPLQFMIAFARPYNADSTRLLLSIGHRNKDAMAKLMGFMGQMLTPRDVRGTQVFDFAFGGVSFAPTNDQMMVGNSKAVDLALAGAGADTLAADAEFKRAAAFAGREAWGVFYFDNLKVMEAVIGFAANKAELQGAGMMNVGAGVAMGMLEAFGSTLGEDPEASGRKIMKYSAASLGTVETNADGVKLTIVQLKPKE